MRGMLLFELGLIAGILLAFPCARAVCINEVVAANNTGITDEYGDHPDWIEFYNGDAADVDLEGYWLSDDPGSPSRWIFPSAVIPAGGYLIVFASDRDVDLHTNFKISSSGETLLLSDPSGIEIDRFATGELEADFSRGRLPDGGEVQRLFHIPTPGASNGPVDQPSFMDRPICSKASGYYGDTLVVTLEPPLPELEVYYTLDGTEPDETDARYSASLSIASTMTLRARTLVHAAYPGAIGTWVFLFDEPGELATAALTMTPADLWDEETGIYVLGPNAEPEPPYYGANFWQDWERPCHLTFIDPTGDVACARDGDVKIHGGYTRHFDQRSLRLIAREEHGAFEHTFFPDLALASFERLVLRNAGNDWCLAHLRDGLMHRIAGPTAADIVAYRPVRTYLNGEYWGIYNLRERTDRYYLAARHAVDPDQVDMLLDEMDVIEGDADHYQEMLAFIESQGLEDDENLAQLATVMDLDNFSDYIILNVFAGNTDWPGNNLLYWRPRTEAGLWRWILYDTDWGLDLKESSDHNTLAYALDPNGGELNPPWSTFLLRSLMTNEGFRHRFINRWADQLNTTLRPERTIALLDSIAAQLAPEMPAHMPRWGRPLALWTSSIDGIRVFLTVRPDHLRDHIQALYNLSGRAQLALDVSPPGAGTITLTTARIDSAWSGEYFMDVPLSLTACAAEGFLFAGWSDEALGDSTTVEILLTEARTVTAQFAAITVPRVQLLGARPNPMRAGELIGFAVDRAREVRITLHDLLGRQVAVLFDGSAAEGETWVPWNGRDHRNQPLPAGVYQLRMQTDGREQYARILFLR